MQRVAIHLLLLASLAPTLFSGATVYHCRMTGIESFACGCCPRESKGEPEAISACCSRHETPAPREATRPEGSSPHVAPPETPGLCACCEIVSARFACLELRERSAEDLAQRLAAAPLAPTLDLSVATTIALRIGARGRSQIPPAIRPPLPLFHAALRC
jgi:hypothetical protein